MVTPELIERLKQVNVSKDKDKTAERVKSAFSAAARKQKAAVENLSGQKRTSIYRVFKTGTLSAKILLPLAEILNISPFWFTGESDDMDKCTDALVLSFLDGRGYKDLSKLAPKPAQRVKKEKAAPAAEKAPKALKAPKEPKAPRVPRAKKESADSGVLTTTLSLNTTPKMRQAVDTLDADSAAQLLRALYFRAKAGGNAEQLLDVVKLCLLS